MTWYEKFALLLVLDPTLRLMPETKRELGKNQTYWKTQTCLRLQKPGSQYITSLEVWAETPEGAMEKMWDEIICWGVAPKYVAWRPGGDLKDDISRQYKRWRWEPEKLVFEEV